jgi:hypothetical protein
MEFERLGRWGHGPPERTVAVQSWQPQAAWS